jgi:hypothetical protein
MRDKPENLFVPVSLGTYRDRFCGFTYETQGQPEDNLGTNRDRDKGHTLIVSVSLCPAVCDLAPGPTTIHNTSHTCTLTDPGCRGITDS